MATERFWNKDDYYFKTIPSTIARGEDEIRSTIHDDKWSVLNFKIMDMYINIEIESYCENVIASIYLFIRIAPIMGLQCTYNNH